MRPLLLPAVRRLWRDATTLQLGSDPGRAIVLANLAPGTAGVLALMDGCHTLGEITALASAHGVGPPQLGELLSLLSRAGVLVEAEPAAGLPSRFPEAARRRLRPDIGALSLGHGAEAGEVLARRSRACTEVWAAGRAGPVVAALLAAAGVGRVHVRGTGTVAADDAAPGGLLPADEHRPYATAAAEAIHRAAPETDTRPPGPRRPPALVVLADHRAQLRPASLPGYARAAALLPVHLRDGAAIVGPLVVPDGGPCLTCTDLHRTDRDPAWPALAAQLRTAARGRSEPSQIALVVAAAGLAATQALAYLDGGTPEALGRSLELTGLGEPIRRRSWTRHPRCGCHRRYAGRPAVAGLAP
ncbi:MAG: hypothetical protein JWO79_526 [Actinomycetia bacterium]|nr:hypothetical protein [Actinomycetes bacterium]